MSRRFRCGIDAGELASAQAARCCHIGGSSKTSSSTSSQTNTQETNLQDTGGLTLANNTGPTKVTVTDSGAIQANSDVSKAAIALGGSAVQAGVSVANRGLDNAAAAYAGGLTFGTNALQTVAQLISQNQSQTEQLVGDALSGYQSIATQNSASSSTQLQKVALYAIGALILILVVPKVFR